MAVATVQKTNTKERIRGPELAVLVKWSPGVPAEEGLARADRENLVIASNKRLSRALVGSDEWKGIVEGLPCRTGTMTGFEHPGKKLGKDIEYFDVKTELRYIFPVPEGYRGERNVILVAEHPDYALEIDGDTRIVRAAKVDLIERFPASDGWYIGDPEHDIPVGEKVDSSDQNARCLGRLDKMVGLVARDHDRIYDTDGRLILLDIAPSTGLGMVVEISNQAS